MGTSIGQIFILFNCPKPACSNFRGVKKGTVVVNQTNIALSAVLGEKKTERRGSCSSHVCDLCTTFATQNMSGNVL